MRVGKLPQTVIVSAALHAGAVAWVATRDIEIDHAPPPETSLTMVELVEPTPLEVSVGATAVASTTGSESASTESSTSTSTSTSTTTTGAGSSETGTPGIDEAPRSPYMDMRAGNRRADLSLPATRDDLDNVPAGTNAQKPDSDRGAHKIDQGPYVTKVDQDGDVTFKDKPDVSIRIAVPTPKMIGRGFAEWYESDKGPDGKRGKRTLESEVSGTIDQPTTGCDGVRDPSCAPDRTPTVLIPVFRGGVNPTDWLMRRTVGDPYASKKRAYLDATRDERAQIRGKHRTEQLAHAAVIMRGNLERAWASTTDVAVRKQLLFELWDEVVDAPDEDSAIAEASRAARAQVIGFIRARLPQRGAHAYSPDEIAALNAKKQSLETFSPYE